MSSKTKATTTAEEAKHVLVPKLRFPAFREEEGWKEKRLAEICHRITNGKANAQDHEDAGDYPLFDRSAVVKRSHEFVFDGEAVILPGEGMRFVPKFFRGKFNLHQRAYALMEHQGDAQFVYYSLDHRQDLLAKRAVQSTVLSLRLPIVENFLIPCPALGEQHKIAECLRSVDELIAAQARKVDALKTHKKGLMQQLFPREGETHPRLRFPQFQNAGEWEETRLGRMGELISGLTYSPEDVRESGLLVLRSSNVQQGEIALADCVYVDPSVKGANLSQPNDILICVRNGSKALIGKCALIPEGMPLCTHGAFMTVFRAQLPSFVFQLFQSDRYQRQVAGDLGATINSINGSQLLKYVFLVPKPPEQKRIASFLSSLDNLIKAESQKHDALKRHKRGLMQQLFPSPEEVDG